MGATFEEQQKAREEYQAKVRGAKRGAKPININPTHTTPNPAVENTTVGESAGSRVDETTADEIIESGEAMGTYGKPAVQREEVTADAAEAQVSDTEPEVPSDEESDTESEDGSEEAAPERPSHSDKKAVWVTYVAALTGETEEDIDDKHTKEELVSQYGG